MLVSMLYRRHPSRLVVLVNSKKVELTLYNKIVRHYRAAAGRGRHHHGYVEGGEHAEQLSVEMTSATNSLSTRSADLKEYNAKFSKRKIIPGLADGHPDNGKDLHRLGHHYMPYIVLVVDEFADLIMTAGKEVETPIARLAQLATVFTSSLQRSVLR